MLFLQTQPTQLPQPQITIELPAMFGPETLAVFTAVGMWAWRKVIHTRMQRLRESLGYTLDWSRDMSGVLHVIRSKTDASRVLIFKAHNNVVHLDKSHFWKISARHEVCAPGIQALSSKSQDIPITDRLETLKLCLVSGQVLYKEREQIQDRPLLNFCEVNGIANYFIFAFCDDTETPLAFLVLHNFDPASLDSIADECKHIDAMLESFSPPTIISHLQSILKNN